MNFQKFVIKIVIACLVIYSLPLSVIEHVNAESLSITGKDQSNNLTEEEQIEIREKLNQDIHNELDIDNNDINVEVTDVNDDSVVMETTYEDNNTESLLNIEFSTETEDIIVSSEVIENGEATYSQFKVEVTEATDTTFVATFKNVETGEEYTYDSTMLQASAVPLLVYIVGAAVLKVVITKVGQKAALKIGKKTFLAKSKDASKKATANFTNFTAKVGSEKVYFTKAKMQHILQGHHPNYWTGKGGKSMFDPDFSVNQVKNIVTNVINSNKTKISTALSKGKPVDIYKTINGIKYKVHIGKDGYVKSAYPV